MNKKLNWETEKFDTSYLCSNAYGFKLIENEIDIQAIEELKILDQDVEFFSPIIVDNRIKINELIKAIKQLDNKISNLQSI